MIDSPSNLSPSMPVLAYKTKQKLTPGLKKKRVIKTFQRDSKKLFKDRSQQAGENKTVGNEFFGSASEPQVQKMNDQANKRNGRKQLLDGAKIGHCKEQVHKHRQTDDGAFKENNEVTENG